jgi:hypothetical protein
VNEQLAELTQQASARFGVATNASPTPNVAPMIASHSFFIR